MQGPWVEEEHNELLCRKDMDLLCSLQGRVTMFSQFICVTERSDLHVHAYTHAYTCMQTHTHTHTREHTYTQTHANTRINQFPHTREYT